MSDCTVEHLTPRSVARYMQWHLALVDPETPHE